MTPFTVIPITNVNLRVGPGISYDIAGQIPSGYNMTASEMEKDGSGTPWYKVGDGYWVNSKYVKQPNEIETPANTFSLKARSTTPVNSSAQNSNNNLIKSVTNTATSLISSATNNLGIFNSITGIAGKGAQDAILTRKIFATPFQFISATDMRPDDTSPLGVQFATNIMGETPILSILPGIPNYMAELSKEEKENITNILVDNINKSVSSISEMANEKLSKANIDMKFFEFQSRTSEYMLYVNLLCRMCAIYIGIGESLVPGTSTKYCEYNWFNWRLSNAYANKTTEVGGVVDWAGDRISTVTTPIANAAKEKVNSIVSTLGLEDSIPKLEATETKSGYAKVASSMNGITDQSNSVMMPDTYYIDFFIKPPQYSESFSNNTTDSMLASGLQQGANLQKEMAFLLGSAVQDGRIFQDNLEAFNRSAREMVNGYMDQGVAKKAFNRLITGSTAIITGSNLIFPEIWQNSSYDRDFQVDITLSTPYGDKESIYLEILVPLMHLLALTLPRQTSVNAYTSPFLVKAVLPGFFSCEMGIVKNMSISKGGSSGDCWTVDGLPTEVQVSMSISDLYKAMAMSNFKTPKNAWNFMYNTMLIDFIGIQCGLNMRSSEFTKKLDLIQSLLGNVVSDQADYTLNTTREEASRSLFKIMAGSRS